MKKAISMMLATAMAATGLAGCGSAASSSAAAPSEAASSEATSAATSEASTGEKTFENNELNIAVFEGGYGSAYWDEIIKRFEDAYPGVTVNMQISPKIGDIIRPQIVAGNVPDFISMNDNDSTGLISSMVKEHALMDLSDVFEEGGIDDDTPLKDQVIDGLLDSAKCSPYGDGKIYIAPFDASPMGLVYNKTLFEENGWEVPTTYDELKELCGKIQDAGITPWFMPGADGWQHQLAFFQIGGVYEEATPGLYDALNTNQATFADNEKMLEVLNEFKELSDAGYFGEDWIGTDSTNLANEFGDRNIAMAMANSSYIQQIKDDTGTEDEFGMFLIPLGDNTWYPTNPAGPTMFGYKGTEHEDLVKEFFNFVTTTESLQEILDNSPAYTNVDMNDDAIEQHWLPEEEEFLATVDDSKKSVSVLQTGTKYTNDYWMQFGQDMVAFCQGEMEANDVLANMDTNRAEAAKTVGDANWN